MKLILTEQMQACVKSALNSSEFPKEQVEEAETIVNVELCGTKEYSISVDLLKQLPKLGGKKCVLFGYLKAKDIKENVYLHELMKGSGVYIEPKPVKPKVLKMCLLINVQLFTSFAFICRIPSLKHISKSSENNKRRKNIMKWWHQLSLQRIKSLIWVSNLMKLKKLKLILFPYLTLDFLWWLFLLLLIKHPKQ